MIDVNTFIGPYPFRHLPDPSASALKRELDRLQVSEAWVGHLPSAFYRDPTPGNNILYRALRTHADRLKPVPTVRPDWPNWKEEVSRALDEEAAAIRAYPVQWGLPPGDERMAELAVRTSENRLPLLLTVRFEDLRQRHPLDSAGDLTAAHIRKLARSDESVRLLVTGAGKGMVEEVHWSLTPAEQTRLLWDISWIWGPPEDHLAKLIGSLGSERFVYGSQWPLRLAEGPVANLDLLPPGVTITGQTDRLLG